MTSTNDLPLATYILQSPQQEMIEPSNLLDLSENRLWQLFSQSVALFSLLCPQLASHPIYHRETFRYSASGCGRKGKSVTYLIRWHVDIYPSGSKILHGIT